MKVDIAMAQGIESMSASAFRIYSPKATGTMPPSAHSVSFRKETLGSGEFKQELHGGEEVYREERKL